MGAAFAQVSDASAIASQNFAIRSDDNPLGIFCFWTGEKQLGFKDGVLNTEAGYMNGREVVKVTYNNKIISEEQLAKFASGNSMKPVDKHKSYRPSLKDEDYYLQHSIYKYLPLSELQRTKINSALGRGDSAEQFLSPKQSKWLNEIKTSKTVKSTRYNKPFVDAWDSLSSL